MRKTVLILLSVLLLPPGAGVLSAQENWQAFRDTSGRVYKEYHKDRLPDLLMAGKSKVDEEPKAAAGGHI